MRDSDQETDWSELGLQVTKKVIRSNQLSRCHSSPSTIGSRLCIDW